MSDILIKDMEMPKTCRLCPLWKFIHVRDSIKDFCDPEKKIIDKPFERPSWCPLIEVSETADWIPYGYEQEIYCWWGKCSNCGEEIFPDDYCPFCGAKLKMPEDITQKQN